MTPRARFPGWSPMPAVVPVIRATFLNAGAILGSASVLLELDEDGRHHRRLLFGDLG